MSLVELYKGFLKQSWPTLEHLQFFRYCTILLPCKSLFLQITADISKITESVRYDLIFNFIELLEAPNSFVKMRLVLEIKNVFSFIKTRFY